MLSLIILIYNNQGLFFQGVTIAVGPRRGVRGGGCHDLSSLKWLNGIKVRGATALQITEEEAGKEDTPLLKECFKHAVNRQVSGSQLKKSIAARVCCFSECNLDSLCSGCQDVVNSLFETEAGKASTWAHQDNGVQWKGIQFPAGLEEFELFSKNNPHICLSIYRAAEDKGEVYLTFRSKLGQLERSKQTMVHIVSVTRLNTEAMELETHFLPVTDLDAFCGFIYEYNAENGRIKTQYTKGEITFYTSTVIQICQCSYKIICREGL